ncbi:hypothetical protein AAES_146339 [Amazona aestiva]|uniref:Uncharacterized protein n=1 Tax=Amazona aestiva TaxID=12930 RepID=A0A0Q3P409_AMAAE|nr:hypothetical protein AAES_146339 [Amazona aestiva]
MATFLGLAYAYRALFNIVQHFQREKNVSGSDDKATDSAASPTPNTAATPALVTSTAATQTPTATDNTATPTSSTAATPTSATSTAGTETLTTIGSAATPAPSTAATPAPVTSTAATQTLTTDTAATPTTVIITVAKPEDQYLLPCMQGKSQKEARKMKQDEETMYSPPGTASDQEFLVHESEEEQEEEMTS